MDAFCDICYNLLDLNECKQPAGNKCHKNADCFNVEGSYLCQCRKGFVGDGFNCRRKKWLVDFNIQRLNQLIEYPVCFFKHKSKLLQKQDKE